MNLLRRVPSKFLILMLIIEIAALPILFGTFQITKIESNNYYSPLFFQQGGKNLFRFDENSFARKLENENPRVKKIIVKKKLPNTLIISFKKRKPLFIVTDRKRRDFFLADGEGIVFSKIENIKAHDLPIFKTERISLKEAVALNRGGEKAAVSLFVGADKLNLNFKELLINSESLIMSKDKIKIIFDSNNFNDSKLKALQLLLKRFTIEGRKPEEINLKFDKPIIKF